MEELDERAQIPDLNHIQHLWDELSQTHQCQTLLKLLWLKGKISPQPGSKNVLKAWPELYIDHIHTAVISAQGSTAVFQLQNCYHLTAS